MNQSILIAAVLGAMTGVVAMAEPLVLGQDDTVEKVLTAQKGRKVTIRLGSGEDLSGTVQEVNGSLVRLSELSGKEFYDAIMAIPRIAAVIVRAKP